MNRRESLKYLSAASLVAAVGAGSMGARAGARKLVFCTYGQATTALWKQGAAVAFTGKTGVDVAFSEAPNPSAALVGAKGSGSYDLGLVTYIDVPMLARSGAIELFDPAEFPELQALPARYKLLDDQGRVCGVGAYQGWYGITYNKKLAKAEDFNSWSSLADPKWKDRIAVNRPQWGAAYELTILSHALGGDERNVDKAVELYKRIAGNALTAYTSTSHMQRLLARGEVVAGPFYSKETQTMIRMGNPNVALVIPKEGGLSVPYAVVAAKGTKNRDQVKQFLRYVTTAECLNGIAQIEPVLPVDPSIQLVPSVASRIGIDVAQMSSRLYAPDWKVVEADWKQRTKICEEIFANLG